MQSLERDQTLMQEVFSLAKLGLGQVAPNPMVGAILVKDGRIIGRGFHQVFGGPHAEVNAILSAQEDVAGSTLYCNLEPCCHTDKKTPPCVPLIIQKGIVRVVVSNLDPNPKVCGKGLQILRDKGIEVETGILEAEGELLNRIFFTAMLKHRPFVHLKLAQSLDGKIATQGGDSKWLSNEQARQKVHQWRADYDAVLVGRATLNQDNPGLNIRMGIKSHGKVPYRIVLGSPHNLNLHSSVFSDNYPEKTLLVTTEHAWELTNQSFKDFFKAKGIGVIIAKTLATGNVDLEDALTKIYQYHKVPITSILVEGGGGVFSSFIEQGTYDQLSLFIAPLLIGDGRAAYQGAGFETVAQAWRFKRIESETIGDNILVHAFKAVTGEIPCSPA